MATAIPYLVALLLAMTIIIAILYVKAIDAGSAANHLADTTQQSTDIANCRSQARTAYDAANQAVQSAEAQVTFSQNQGLAAEANGGVAVEADGTIVTLEEIVTRSARERAAVVRAANDAVAAQMVYDTKVRQAITDPDQFVADCKAEADH